MYKTYFTLSTDKDLTKKILAHYNYDATEVLEYAGALVSLNDCNHVLCVHDNSLTTINHEVVHLATACLKYTKNSCDISHNDEQLAYLIEYITDLIYAELGIQNLLNANKKIGFRIKNKVHTYHVKLKS